MIVEFLNGDTIDVEYFNLFLREQPIIPSVSLEHTTTTIDGRDGLLFLDSRFSGRTIIAGFIYKSSDVTDYVSLRNQLNSLFARKESFFIIFKSEPTKRWRVKLASSLNLEPDEIEIIGELNIEFVCENIFAESVNIVRRKFTESSFRFNNIGDVLIDPRCHEIEISIKGDFPNGLQIKNESTGDIYEYFGELKSAEELKLDGVRSVLNGKSVFGQTNHKLITFNPGWNNMLVSGSNGPFELMINTRYYLL